jgi:hypothetical protein
MQKLTATYRIVFLARVDDAFQPGKVEKAVRTVWRELAEAVWQQDFGSEYAQTPTRLIWERQINGFWDNDLYFGWSNPVRASRFVDRRIPVASARGVSMHSNTPVGLQ